MVFIMMNSIMKKVVMFAVALAVMFQAVVAEAAITMPLDLPVSDVETLAGLALVGLGIMWAIRKVIKTINRC